MPLRSLCCCRADEAVVARKAPPTTSQNHDDAAGPPGLIALSDVSSLAYMDAVADEKDWIDLTPTPSTLQRMGSTGDIFYDAASASSGASGQVERGGRGRIRNNVIVTTTQQEQPVHDDDDDEHLLAPEFRSDASASTKSSRHHHRAAARKNLLSGFPGQLTPAQLKAYQEFRTKLREGGADTAVYRDMVDNYRAVEPESYALCRYLRLHKFNVKKTFVFMHEHKHKWNEAAANDFYPNIEKAVGAPLSVLLTQFPSLYYGNSKEGYPVCYFNAGGLCAEGMECVTKPENLANVIWYNMMHDLKYNLFPAAKKRHPDFVR